MKEKIEKIIREIPAVIPVIMVSDSEIAKQAGVEIIFAPHVMPWGGLLCKVQDPEGYIWFLETVDKDFTLDNVPVVPSSK